MGDMGDRWQLLEFVMIDLWPSPACLEQMKLWRKQVFLRRSIKEEVSAVGCKNSVSDSDSRPVLVLDNFLSPTKILLLFVCCNRWRNSLRWCPSIKLSLFLVLEFKSLFEPIYYLHGCVTVMLAVIQREKTEKPKLPKQLERIAICEGISNSNARGNLLSLIKWLGW